MQPANYELLDGEGGHKKRRCTDLAFLYTMAAFLLVTFGLLIYTATLANPYRILNGYDNCGNICGKKNDKISGMADCIGRDMTDKPFLVGNESERQCVKQCSEFDLIEVNGRCENSTDKEIINLKMWSQLISDNLRAAAFELFYMTFISLAIVTLVMLALRYYTACFLWGVLILVSLIAVTATALVWYAYSKGDKNQIPYLALGIPLTFITVLVVVLVALTAKRIKSLIPLFKEASRAVCDVPLLLIQPLITITAYIITFMLIAYLSMMVGSAGVLTRIAANNYDYVPNEIVFATGSLLFAAFLWLNYFYMGCQHMIVGGTVCTWYFSSTKKGLGGAVFSNTAIMLRYHLGTIAFGSLIMLVMQMINMIIDKIRKKMRQSGCGFCLECFGLVFRVLEDFVAYFSKLAYIMTAMHGTNFFHSGKSAMKLLIKNGVKAVCMNIARSFILFFVYFLVLLLTGIIAMIVLDKPGLHNIDYPLIASLIIALVISHCFMSVYDTAIDAIFLCYCQDKEHNDGVLKPYYTSDALLGYIDKYGDPGQALPVNNDQNGAPIV